MCLSPLNWGGGVKPTSPWFTLVTWQIRNWWRKWKSVSLEIDSDIVLESGLVEQLIEENSYTPFPTCQTTERPDSVVGAIAEGRIGIIVDGAPLVLLVPTTLNTLMQSPEDYYNRWYVTTLARLVRFVGNFFALVPAGTVYRLDLLSPGNAADGPGPKHCRFSGSGYPFPLPWRPSLCKGP